jgi:RNA polymerase sporulation-specific sigma factor
MIMWMTMANLLSQMVFLVLSVVNSGSFPKPLSAKEERAAFAAMAAGDKAARQKLIEHNLRLVAHIIRKKYAGARDQEDLVSIGTIGLIKGVTTFDPSKGARLATYAARCVENEILMYFRSQKKSAQDVSLSDYIETGNDGAALSLMDVVGEEEDLLERIATRQTLLAVTKAVNTVLTPQERQVISLRYGLGDTPPQRQREVARITGISRSYVSRIEKRALEKLREALG